MSKEESKKPGLAWPNDRAFEEHKAFQQRVRARQQRTGEKYQLAFRRQQQEESKTGVAIVGSRVTPAPTPSTTAMLPDGIKETTMNRGKLRTKTRQESDEETERRYVDRMVRRLSLPLIGEPVKMPPPQADFRLELRRGDGTTQRIALEVVRAVNQDLARGHGVPQSLKRRVLELLSAAQLPASVTMSLSEGAAALIGQLGRTERPAAVEREAVAVLELVRGAVAMLATTEGLPQRFEWLDDSDESTDFPVELRRKPDPNVLELAGRGIEYLTYVVVRTAREPKVYMNGGAGAQPASIVEAAIEKKRSKIVGYRRAAIADEYWLLVVGSSWPGGALDMGRVNGGRYSSPFDKTIFLELHDDECKIIARSDLTVGSTVGV
jgi:hypothetical protein